MVSGLRQGNRLEEVRWCLDRSPPFPSKLIHHCTNGTQTRGMGLEGVLAQPSDYWPLHRQIFKSLGPVSSLHLPYGTGSLEGRAVLRELPINDSLAHTAVHIEFLGGRKLL